MAPKIPQIVNCGSSTLLEYELEHVRHDLSLNETEETWDKIARAVQYLEAIAKGTTQDLFPELVSAVKLLARPITNALLSDRSRLSGHAAELVTTLATCFKRAFDPLISAFVPSLLQGCARSNKVFVSKSKACLMAIVEHVQSPLLLPHFRSSVSDKSLSLRLIATELVLACMNCFNPPDLETVSRAEDIETVIRATATDASAEVRKCSRSVFEAYKILLPGRLDECVIRAILY
ncbi:hypothetical protein SCHPADRAFT_834397 [Schizopora paradoxa]|uniref:CLASP N-terminal domain-containing protein n=1 Tax=Schizopora paradoxa TaxID=27342 RepID=A0A0H2RC78_9AGAM|nr:hypothetical protein SCHPADRAFT_834397 [Schizopora paradoxa]